MTQTRFKVRGIVFFLGGLAPLVVAASIPQFQFVPIAIGLGCLFVAESSFSNAGELAPSVRLSSSARFAWRYGERLFRTQPRRCSNSTRFRLLVPVSCFTCVPLRAVPGLCSKLPNPGQRDLKTLDLRSARLAMSPGPAPGSSRTSEGQRWSSSLARCRSGAQPVPPALALLRPPKTDACDW